MDFCEHLKHLSERARPATERKITSLDNGMQYFFRWDPVHKHIQKRHMSPILQDNTILVYFKKHMTAVQFPRGTFGTLLPKTWLDDSFIIKYRCSQTGNILQGACLIASELSPEMIMLNDITLLEGMQKAV